MRVFIASFFSLISSVTFAQEVPLGIQVLAKSKKEGVWLRWAPANASIWSMGNRHGYIIERFTLKPDGTLESPLGEKLTNTPVKPISESAFEKLSNEVEEASVVQELIYGEDALKSYTPNSPASVLVRNREMENQFGIALLMCDLSRKVAEAGGLFFADPSATIGKRYIYRVSLAFQPKGSTIEPGVLVVDVTDEQPIASIKELTTEFADRKATLKWPTLLHRGIYSAYYIEKSLDGKAFTKITDLPYVHLSQSLESESAYYVDSLESNNQTVYYRIYGITPFAEEGPVSNVSSGVGKDNLSGLLVIREGRAVPPKNVNLKWEFPSEAEKEIAGFTIGRSNLPNGPFLNITKTVIPKNVREFLDDTSFYNTYYIVKAVDNTGGELSQSFPYLVQIEDTTPPATPTGLKSEVDKNGKVTMTWNNNTDVDLLGYRVFQSNSLEEEFTEITKSILLQPTFIDSLNMNVLNKKVYYSVVAVDKNYNPSEYSSHLSVNRPDIIPPVAPVFTLCEVKDGKINLAWENGRNDDIAKLELTRIEKENRVMRQIISWSPLALAVSYTEPVLRLGETYRYKLTAIDSAGNFSETLSNEIFYETGVRPSVKNLQVMVDREQKKVALEWKNDSPALRCLIYRRKNDSTFTLYQTLDGNIETFIDKAVSPNNTYGYKVQLVYVKGIKSLISDEISTNY